jgi:AraC-like DNA-binding protein
MMAPFDTAIPVTGQSQVAAAPAQFDSRHIVVPDIKRSGSRLAIRSKEAICRVDMPGATGRIAEWRGVRAQLLTMDRGATCEWEFHLPSLVIMTQLDGGPASCEWTDGGEVRKITALPPHSVLCNPATEYLRIRRRMQRGTRLLMLTVDPDDLEPLLDDLAPSQVQFRQRVDLTDTLLHHLLQAIAEEIETSGPGGRLYRHTLTLLLLAQLVRCASNLAQPVKRAYKKGGLPSWRLKRALELLDSGLTERPTLTELACDVGLHPTSFCRAFKQSMGISPHRYLLERRVQRAKEMMTDHTLTLTQVALDCGFSTSSQFSVIFRRIVGLTPSTYRRSL